MEYGKLQTELRNPRTMHIDRLDTLDAAYRGERLAVLAGCAFVYVAATLAAGKKSIRLFEKQDL